MNIELKGDNFECLTSASLCIIYHYLCNAILFQLSSKIRRYAFFRMLKAYTHTMSKHLLQIRIPSSNI